MISLILLVYLHAATYQDPFIVEINATLLINSH